MTPPVLRPQQRAILDSLDRHVLVSAGAGSGKTFTVVRALLHRLGVEVPGAGALPAPLTLEQVAAISFTNASAAELVRSLRDALTTAGRADLAERVDAARIGTIHGFAGELLRGFGLRGARRAPGRLALEGEARELLAAAARETLLEALETNEVPGLGTVLATYAVDVVSRWLEVLAADGGRLEALSSLTPRVHPDETHALLTLATRTREAHDHLLAELPAVDFDRLLTWTRDLLRDADVLAAVRARLRLLVVDEFQDVDPVQRDLVLAIGGIEPDDPRGTRLLLVGDPKQSIYRFRRADVSVWREVEERFAAMPTRAAICPLHDSFRSVPGILAFVDHVMAPAMNAEPEGGRKPYEVGYASLTPTRPAVGDAPAVEIIAPRRVGETTANAERIREVDAAAVVARLQVLQQSGLLAVDGTPLSWRHMAILVRARASADPFAAALRSAGVPFYFLRSAGLLETREVLDAMLALRAVRDPRDSVAMAGVLRSPFVGVRDETLLALAQGGGLDTDVPQWTLAPDEAMRLADGRALLARLRARLDRVPAHQLLEQLLDEGGYRAHLALRGDEDAAQALANLARFARLLEEDPRRSIGGWLRELAERRAREDDVSPARLVGPEEPFVTITTIHAAKGLDWDVVVWADLARTTPGDRGTNGLFITRDGIALAEPGVDKQEQDPVVQALRSEGEREADAERLRLRYVAATRAKSRLIVSGVLLKATKGTDAAWLGAALGLDADSTSGTLTVPSAGGQAHPVLLTVVDVRASDDARKAPPTSPAPLVDGTADIVLPPAAVAVPMGRLRHSATALMLHAQCERRYAWKYLLGVAEPRDVEGGAHASAGATKVASKVKAQREAESVDARMSPAELGTTVHEILARADEQAELDALLSQAEAEWNEDDAAPGRGWHPDDRAAIRAQVEAALAGHYGHLARREHARRELRFLRVLPDGSALEGAIDLAAPDGDGVAIVDVKTGRVRAGEESDVASKYTVQRDAYVEAVEAISGRSVTSFDFVFTATGATVAGAADRARLTMRERVAAAERTVPDHASLAVDPATCVRCGYKAAGWCAGVR